MLSRFSALRRLRLGRRAVRTDGVPARLLADMGLSEAEGAADALATRRRRLSGWPILPGAILHT